MDRVKTGIPGMDELLGGGFLEGAQVVVAGGSGTGKTIFGLQYLYNGATQFDDPGALIVLEESPRNISWNMKNFGWDLTSLIKQNKIGVYRFSKYDPSQFKDKFSEQVAEIKSLIESIGAKRVVIDSITTLSVWMAEEWLIRYNLFMLIDVLRSMGVTSVLTAESREGDKYSLGRFDVEEYVADGGIKLILKPPNRIMYIRKMRGIKHDMRLHPYEISDHGIVVHYDQEVMWESIQ